MLANYHTHTYRCRHATGTEQEYIDRALMGGMKILGFSDHTPYWFDVEGYYSKFRMWPEQFDEYIATVLSLRDQYQDRMEIHLGVEAEFYPKYFDRLLTELRARPIEYMLLGQHWLGNEIGDTYSAGPTQDRTVLDRYCGQVIEAMQTGLFTYLAHPDIVNFQGDEAVYERQMRKLCRAAKDNAMALEVNFLGLRESRHYPNERFWRIAGEEGNDVIFGCDGHCVEAMWEPAVEAKARSLVERFGLHRVETVPLRAI